MSEDRCYFGCSNLEDGSTLKYRTVAGEKQREQYCEHCGFSSVHYNNHSLKEKEAEAYREHIKNQRYIARQTLVRLGEIDKIISKGKSDSIDERVVEFERVYN